MADKRKISLVLADVDGTLVTEQKVLTKRAQAAVHSLRGAGIRFAVTSGRPAKGMAMLVDPLQLDTPIAGFNGGLVVKPDFTIIDQKTVPADVAAQVVELLRAHGLDVWVYRGNDWLVGKAEGAARRARGLDRQVRAEGGGGCRGEARPGLQDRRRQRRSGQGAAVRGRRARRPSGSARRPTARSPTTSTSPTRTPTRARWWNSCRDTSGSVAEIATIGDQPTDVPMFQRSGFSIAMGNASDQVKAQASVATDSYNDEGFAKAMERFILGA